MQYNIYVDFDFCTQTAEVDSFFLNALLCIISSFCYYPKSIRGIQVYIFVYSIILFVFERLITRVTPGTNVQFIIENVESKEGD